MCTSSASGVCKSATFSRGSKSVTTTTNLPVAGMGSNGPQCAHCGWRGGGHACVILFVWTLPAADAPCSPNCPFR
ncbi:unnamed protein product [Mycena citricolor]|uniref:Uncharacterized protein n=1 Tax=Mycena citricolor TaxID=2018698 RepID=A0AAD2GRE4_9AGAR|nr:unnamed protein product [Mycena citricolor]